ncbi:hypothetical protein QYF61_009474 [Mycteria americana]|uniref:Rna-directed dna polymerase from mobile element jockey-like n=1 Tax=Mycteria americana TaxID=33587 RepID=A0AAN7PI07_MYCAM|nr:hypothetical protein QYF61_009474 [Mycteria americana]
MQWLELEKPSKWVLTQGVPKQPCLLAAFLFNGNNNEPEHSTILEYTVLKYTVLCGWYCSCGLVMSTPGVYSGTSPVIFINDLKEEMEYTLTKFADDTKQGDLDGLEEWTNRDLMKFNKDKCKVLYLEQTNPLQQCGLGIGQLGSGSAEQDLEVLVGSGLKGSQQ